MSAIEERPTRAIRLTPPGRAAVAVLLVEGPQAIALVDAQFQAANGKPLGEQQLNRICFGRWQSDGEELIVVRRAKDRVEVHTHGGHAASRAVLAALTEQGAELAEWSAWIDDQSADTIEAAATGALTKARTLRTARILLEQQQGALQTALLELNAALRELRTEESRQRTEALLARAPVGLHLTQPWRVALCGRPNVGKSSLLNAVLGYARSIVFDLPGTTRDVVTAWTALDGWPVELSDSAGLRDSLDPLERAGVSLATNFLRSVDLRVLVIDANEGLTAEDRQLIEAWRPEVIAVNKIDVRPDFVTDGTPPGNIVRTSAKTCDGLEQVIAAIVAGLVPTVPEPGAAIPFTLAQQAMLREVLAALQAGQVEIASEALRPHIDELS